MNRFNITVSSEIEVEDVVVKFDVVPDDNAVFCKFEEVCKSFVVEVCSCSFVSKIYRMLKRKIPDWEGFELSIAGFNSTLVFMIELGKAGSHFSASRAWRCNYN